MRLFTGAAIALLGLLLLPGIAGASHASGAGGPQDFAVGGGTFGNPSTGVQHVDFAASGGPSPSEPVTGHFRAGGAFDPLGITEFQQEGPVTCLVVQGHEARLVYPIKHATPPTNEDAEVLIFIRDNGPPPENGQPRDQLGFVLLPDESTDEDPPSEQDSECIPPVNLALSEVQEGNFTVHDAP